jgi:lysophospholipase L1-like esterase
MSRFRLFYQAWRRGGEVHISLDEAEPLVLSTTADAPEDRVYDLELPDGPHEVGVTAAGPWARLYGVVMEREGPGVVVDGLMLVGARGRRLAFFDADHLGNQVSLRGSDLLVFWMGANDAESEYWNRNGFITDYGAGIAAARSRRPEVSCLVVSILDMGEREGGRTRRRVPRIVEAQREIAAATGCAFFDFFEAMGGAGSIQRWFRSDPRLASGDYTHLTAPGARVAGQIFTETLLRGYDEWLARGGDGSSESPAPETAREQGAD